MSLPVINDSFTLNENTSTYTLNNNIETSSWTRVDFGILNQNVIIDGNHKKITLHMNNLDGLFIGGGNVSVNNNDVVISQFILELKNMTLIVNGNVKCGFLVALGTVKFTNCHLIINGNINDSGGGFTYVGDNTTSSFKTITILNSSSIIYGNIGVNSGPLSGYMANGNYVQVSKTYSIVSGNIGDNAGGFLGAYNGSNRSAIISGCYCIVSGNMGAYAGVLSGSYFCSNGTITINDTYMITNIMNTPLSSPPQTNYACYLSNHRSNIGVYVNTITNFGVLDISNKNLYTNGYTNNGNWITGPSVNLQKFNLSTYNAFKANIIDTLSMTYFETSNLSYFLKYNNNDYILSSIKNIDNYNWLLTNNLLSIFQVSLSMTPLSVNEGENYIGTLSIDSPYSGIYSILYQSSGNLYLSGNKVYSKNPFEYNKTPSYDCVIQVVSGNIVISKKFTIQIINIPQMPSNIIITNNKLPENCPIGSFVGQLYTFDPDNNDVFQYEFTPGEGSYDNHLFILNTSNIYTNTVFNYNQKKVYSIRIKSTDSFGYYIEKVLTIDIIIPVANQINMTTLLNTPKRVILNGTSVSGLPLVYTILTNPKYGSITKIANGIYNYLPIDNKIDTFKYMIQEGTMTSLPGDIIMHNYSQTDVNNVSKSQGTFTFDSIRFDGNEWVFGTMQADNFFQFNDYNIFGNWQFNKK